VELTLPKGATAAVETNLLEQPQGPALQLHSDKVTIPIHAYEILSIQVDYPAK
jgi:alpha-mannosidase